jgi:CubicO group peptidase (beta-lactamase class C family)
VYQCLLDGGAAPNGQQIIRRETVAEMTSRQRVGLKDHSFGQVVDWGLGFLINSRPYGALADPYGYGRHASDETFGHGGMQSSAGFCDAENGLAGAIIFNGLPGEPKHQKRINDVMTALYEDMGIG